MNQITRESLLQAAREFPELAEENGSEFRVRVREAYWLRICDLHERRLCARAVQLWRVFSPQDFNQAGDVLDFAPGFFSRTLRVYKISMRVLERKIEREEALQLSEWEEIPQITPEGQYKLF